MGEVFDLVRLWWVAVGVLAPAAIGYLGAVIRTMRMHGSAMDEGMKYLLKDRILQNCQQWQERGYCPMHSREVINDMVIPYKALGGNSFIESEVAQTMALPLRKGDRHGNHSNLD